MLYGCIEHTQEAKKIYKSVASIFKPIALTGTHLVRFLHLQGILTWCGGQP